MCIRDRFISNSIMLFDQLLSVNPGPQTKVLLSGSSLNSFGLSQPIVIISGLRISEASTCIGCVISETKPEPYFKLISAAIIGATQIFISPPNITVLPWFPLWLSVDLLGVKSFTSSKL